MDRREGKKEAKRNGGCVTDILLAIEIILFLFVCELFIINFFLFLNLCGFFFVILFFVVIPYLVFLLILGGCHLLRCLLLFIYLFLFIYFFFTFMDFLGGFLCKFNCSWHFFTSSDRVPSGGLVDQAPRFEDRYRMVVSYTIDDLGKRVA